jgi:hypothetical protein
MDLMPQGLRLPDAELAAWVAEAVGRDPASVTILSRGENPYTSTWPTETVRCRIGGEREMRLMVKNGPCGVRNAHGHLVGPAYESVVYQTVLPEIHVSHPFVAFRRDPGTQWGRLLLEHLEEGWWRVNRFPDPHAIVRVAAWLGGFHAKGAARVHDFAGVLPVYDAEYYAGWARRSARYVAHLGDDVGWLTDVCREFVDVGARLAAGPSTVVHGELYPQNVLVTGTLIRPVDWEWTGVGAGEVDLAALTEGWSAELTEASERMYADVRWLGVPPRDHAWRLDAARIYMHLRWLGDRTDRLGARELPERLEDLQRIARRIGML